MHPISENAVRRQLAALGSDRYVVAIWDRERAAMNEERCGAEAILNSGSHLDHFNRRGHDIYFRPDDSLRFTFLDDLKAAAIGDMKRQGFAPAVIVETSPGNFQAWLKHPQPLGEKRLGTLAAQSVARRFGSDPSAAAYLHNGRLAGFQNLKPKYRDEAGRQPYVKLAEASGRIYAQAPTFIERIVRDLAALKEQEFRRSVQVVTPERRQSLKSIDEFRAFPRFQGDLGRGDLSYAVYARRNGLSPKEIAQALATRDLSHKGDSRRQQEYIERTLKKAERSLGIGR